MKTEIEIFTLDEFIDRFYGGNKSWFADANRLPTSSVYNWLSVESYVINGKLYLPKHYVHDNPPRWIMLNSKK